MVDSVIGRQSIESVRQYMNTQINKPVELLGCFSSCESEGTGSAPFHCCQVGYLAADNAVGRLIVCLSFAHSAVS
jgi:hypothetical protein